MSIIITGVGRIGKDAQTRFTQGGEAVTGFSLAMDNGFGDKKQTLWFDASLWCKRGESVAPYLVKGAQVFVVGELGEREHEGKVYKTMRLQTLDLVGGKPEGSAGSGGSRGGAPQRSRPARATDAPMDDFGDDDIPFATNRSTW